MIAAEIIGQVLAAGGQIAADGPDLVLTAPRPLPVDLLDRLAAHKRDILAALAHGDIPLGTVQAFEQAAIAREAADLREAFEERAGILEYDARPTHGTGATCGHPYGRRSRITPPCWPRCPTRPGRWTPYPWGVAEVAVRKDGRVVWQGAFTGAQEVKA